MYEGEKEKERKKSIIHPSYPSNIQSYKFISKKISKTKIISNCFFHLLYLRIFWYCKMQIAFKNDFKSHLNLSYFQQ